MMSFVVEFAPYSVWFGYMKMNDSIRDLGDYVFWVFKFQITIWTKKPSYRREYLKHLAAFKARFPGGGG